MGILATAFALVCVVIAWGDCGIGGRVFLVFALGATFVLPLVFASPVVAYGSLAGRMLLGIGCFFYSKLRRYL